MHTYSRCICICICIYTCMREHTHSQTKSERETDARMHTSTHTHLPSLMQRLAGNFMFQLRDFNFDTGAVAGIFISQFRELNRTVAGILTFQSRDFTVAGLFILQFRDLNSDTRTVAGIFTSKLRDVRLSVSKWCVTAGFAGMPTAAHGHGHGNLHFAISRLDPQLSADIRCVITGLDGRRHFYLSIWGLNFRLGVDMWCGLVGFSWLLYCRARAQSWDFPAFDFETGPSIACGHSVDDH